MMLAKMIVLKSLEKSINHYLKMDSDHHEKIAPLSGKHVAMELAGANFNFVMGFTNERITFQTELMKKPDLTIRATPVNLGRLFFSEDSTALIQNDHVEVFGNLGLAQKVQTFMQQLNPDWQRHFSIFLGDIPTQKFEQASRLTKEIYQKSKKRFLDNLKEYLQEETSLLVSRNQADYIHDSIIKLRDDTDRLEQQIKQLIKQQDDSHAH